MVTVVIIVVSLSSSLVSLRPHLPSETEPAKGKRKARPPLKLAPAHEAWIASFLPSQRRMPYIDPQPAPPQGRLSHDRCETDTRRQSREDPQPKAAHQAQSLHALTHSGGSDLTPFFSFPPQGVGGCVCACACLHVCGMSVCTSARASVLLCVCVAYDQVERARPSFFFHHTVLLIACFQLLPNETGKQNPRGF